MALLCLSSQWSAEPHLPPANASTLLTRLPPRLPPALVQNTIATAAPARQESDNSTFIDQKFASGKQPPFGEHLRLNSQWPAIQPAASI